MTRTAPARRVLIFSADIGEGHATAARALERSLRAAGAEVEHVADLSSLGRVNRLALRDGSRLLFRWAPKIYDVLYRLLLRSAVARRLAAGSLKGFGARPLLRRVDASRPDVIVSTYPGVTAVLGALRSEGRLTLPTVATITDLAGLFFWAHPGIDLHLASWNESLPESRRVAAGAAVRHVGALCSPEFFAARTKQAARRALGLPRDRSLILVSGGGWGVGRLAEAVRVAAAVSLGVVVCVAGRNARAHAELSRSFGGRADVHVLGFTDRMSDLLAAADALVHSTGGVTCLEASLRGCPVVIHGFSAGHVRHNAEALVAHGLARSAATADELEAALRELVAAPAPAPLRPPAVDPGQLVLAARAQPTRTRVTRAAPLRRPVAVALASAAALLFAQTGLPAAAHGIERPRLRQVAIESAELAITATPGGGFDAFLWHTHRKAPSPRSR